MDKALISQFLNYFKEAIILFHLITYELLEYKVIMVFIFIEKSMNMKLE